MAAERRKTDPGGADWRDKIQPGDVVQINGTRGKAYVKVTQVDRKHERTTRVKVTQDSTRTANYNNVWVMRGGLVQKGTAEQLAAQSRNSVKRDERKR